VPDAPAPPVEPSGQKQPVLGNVTNQDPGSGRHISFAKEPGLEVVMESLQESDTVPASVDSDSDDSDEL
jgi:hypothetical protein